MKTCTLLLLTISLNLLYCGPSKTMDNKENLSYPDLCDSLVISELLQDKSLQAINKEFKTHIRENKDGCVLEILDYVAILYLKSPTIRNFEIINELSCSFDGYITEYFIDLFTEIAKRCSGFFFKSLHELNDQKESSKCLYMVVKTYLNIYDINGKVLALIDEEISKSSKQDYIIFLENLIRGNETD